MKKIVFLLVSILLCLSMVSCSALMYLINTPTRERMLDYYADDSNYVEVQGIVVGITQNSIMVDIDGDHPFDYALSDGQPWFQLLAPVDLEIGDLVTLVSAPGIFYDGHRSPIAALEKDGEILLSFEEGKRLCLEEAKEF